MDWKSLFSFDVPVLEIILRGSVIYISLFILPLQYNPQPGRSDRKRK